MAPDLSAKKAQSWNNLTKMKWTQKNCGKGYATTRRTQRRNVPENLRRLPLSTKRMEYISFDGIVMMFLRVVAPRTPVTIDGF